MTRQRTSSKSRRADAWLWAPILLSVAGIGISGYLVAKRFTGGGLACSRWAQCDVVNNSMYAVLYGVPVSVIGLAGYLLLLAVGVAALRSHGANRRRLLALALLLALGGVAFSAYLTYVEIYLIQALCSWCVASAVVILLLAAVGARNVLAARQG